MIDIHTHIIPMIDDGASSLEKSFEMLKREKDIGVTDVICTPHFRRGVFEKTKSQIEENFELIKETAKELGINLYLGQEIATRKNIVKQLKSGEFLTLAGSRYVLLEFDYNNYVDISEICFELIVAKYIPVIAHVERYTYVTAQDVMDFIYIGAKIQVNASSLLEGMFGKHKAKVMKYIKEGLVHFIASDFHYSRVNELDRAKQIISKKFGQVVANDLFEKNARNIIENKEF